MGAKCSSGCGSVLSLQYFNKKKQLYSCTCYDMITARGISAHARNTDSNSASEARG